MPRPPGVQSGGENEGGASGGAASAQRRFEARGCLSWAQKQLGLWTASAVGRPLAPGDPQPSRDLRRELPATPARPEPFAARPLRLE